MASLYGPLVAEIDGNGNLVRTYTWGGNGLISDNSAAGCRFYLFDSMGNTRFLVNASGTVVGDAGYTAYGANNSGSYLATPFAWKGQFGLFRDSETSLVYCQSRYYAPFLGRFLSRDTYGFLGGPNLYSYCNGDPICRVDGDGHCAHIILGAGLGALIYGGIAAWQGKSDQEILYAMLKGAVVGGVGAATFGLAMPALVGEAGAGLSCLQAATASGAFSGITSDLVGQSLDILTGRQKKFNSGEALMAAGTGALTGYASEYFFGGGGCFVAGTPVQAVVEGPDGKYHAVSKPIEKIRKGDLVLARNEKTGKTQVRRALRATVRQVDKVLTVALADAKTHKVVERITASREHPFYVRGKGFVPAGGLAVGNSIVTRAGPSLAVASIKWHRKAEGYRVYNFVVEDDHSYFVGRSGGGVWVHNPTCGQAIRSVLNALRSETGTSVTVATREEAQQVLMKGVFSETGVLPNTTGTHPGDLIQTYGADRLAGGYYHYDEVFDSNGLLEWHGNEAHASQAHLQVNFPALGTKGAIRIFFGPAR